VSVETRADQWQAWRGRHGAARTLWLGRTSRRERHAILDDASVLVLVSNAVGGTRSAQELDDGRMVVVLGIVERRGAPSVERIGVRSCSVWRNVRHPPKE